MMNMHTPICTLAREILQEVDATLIYFCHSLLLIANQTSRAQVWLDDEMMKQYCGAKTPGPCSYKTPGSLGKQVCVCVCFDYF